MPSEAFAVLCLLCLKLTEAWMIWGHTLCHRQNISIWPSLQLGSYPASADIAAE